MRENQLFVLYYLTVLVFIKTAIHLSVGGWRWIFISPLLGWVNIHHWRPPLRWIVFNYLAGHRSVFNSRERSFYSISMERNTMTDRNSCPYMGSVVCNLSYSPYCKTWTPPSWRKLWWTNRCAWHTRNSGRTRCWWQPSPWKPKSWDETSSLSSGTESSPSLSRNTRNCTLAFVVNSSREWAVFSEASVMQAPDPKKHRRDCWSLLFWSSWGLWRAKII